MDFHLDNMHGIIGLKEGSYVLRAVFHVPEERISSMQAVVSVKKLRCDYGHEFPYKRKVQIPDDGEDTIYADSQKRYMERMPNLRSSETHEQILPRQAENRKHMAGLRSSETEGMSSAQCSMRLKKVCPQCRL